MAQPAFKDVLKYSSIFVAFGNCSSQRNDARVLASKGTFGTCPGARFLDGPFLLLLTIFSLLASFHLSFAGFCEHVRIQPSSSRLFSLPLVSGDFRIQEGNSMNQSELITNTCSPFQQSAGNRARTSPDWFKSHL